MMIPLLLAQAVAGPFLPAAPRAASYRWCPVASETTDVVVCARNQDSFRLHSVAPQPEKQLLPKAEMRLGDTKVAAEGEAVGLPMGNFTNRAMFHWRVPLGRKKKPEAR